MVDNFFCLTSLGFPSGKNCTGLTLVTHINKVIWYNFVSYYRYSLYHLALRSFELNILSLCVKIFMLLLQQHMSYFNDITILFYIPNDPSYSLVGFEKKSSATNFQCSHCI